MHSIWIYCACLVNLIHQFWKMASRGDVDPSPALSEGVQTSSRDEEEEESMEKLRRIQLAHEGMRLLLCSQVKQAEELFRTSRYLGPELNAGHSFVQMVRAIMTFEDEAMDSAYKCLEATEKFCETNPKKFGFFSSSKSLSSQELTEHERLYRRAVVADCLLFEAILVFLKQGLTSYVKGGYLLRKAWKMYEKIFRETEQVCSLPSPIFQEGVSSPQDKNIGTSMYDRPRQDLVPEEGEEDEEEEEEEEEKGEGGMEDEIRESSTQLESSLGAIGNSLAGMHLGFAAVDGVSARLSLEDEGDERLSAVSSAHREMPNPSSQDLNLHVIVSHDGGSHDSGPHDGESHDRGSHGLYLSVNGGSNLAMTRSSSNTSRGTSSSQHSSLTSSRTSSRASSRSGSEENLRFPSMRLGGAGTDEPDGKPKKRKLRKKKKRPQSGFFLPSVPSSGIQSLEHEDERLRGAVYFGYGLMNIIMSLIPPKLMKLANLFGFHGDRRIGLLALEFSSNSQDMKAPLARIALLWYHTIVRPFFALDGEQEDAGAGEAERLLVDPQRAYPASALFLYFKGKVMYLRCQLNEALQVYTDAAALSRDQREVEHICLYEKGWVHFLQLDYAQALPCYIRLKNETRWSACYYTYLAAVMTGIQGDLKQSRELFLQSSKLVKGKTNNLEKFCARRGVYYKKGVTLLMPLEVRLMAMEVIYLWRALPFCSEATKRQLLDTLEMAMPPDSEPYHYAMRAWLRGGVLASLKQDEDAEKSLREAIQYEPQIKHDKHIISFSLYEIALIHINRYEYARARNLLNIAKDGYSGYEFEARLHFKVHAALNLLR